MKTIGLFSGVLLFSVLCLLPEVRAHKRPNTHTRPLLWSFDTSVGMAMHWKREGRGFESRSEPEFFRSLLDIYYHYREHLREQVF